MPQDQCPIHAMFKAKIDHADKNKVAVTKDRLAIHAPSARATHRITQA